MQINNHTFLISGANSGLGLETAHHLNALGAKLILIDTHTEHMPEGNHILSFSCDIRDDAMLEHCIKKSKNQFDEIHGCVNCAGIAPAQKIVSKNGLMPLEDFKKVINVNLIGNFNCMRLVIDSMTNNTPQEPDQERGIIINTASIAAFEGQIGQTAYAASKGAINALTLPAARELAKLGIRVNAIAPGIFATPMLQGMPDEVKSSLIQQIPFPKRFGEAKEFAQLVQHIIENTALNGTTIRLDNAVRMNAK